jgi:hypothetical protein
MTNSFPLALELAWLTCQMLNVKYMHVISFFYTKKNLVEFGFDGTLEKADSINGFLIENIFWTIFLIFLSFKLSTFLLTINQTILFIANSRIYFNH